LYWSIIVAAVYRAYCLQLTAQIEVELETHSKQECMCMSFLVSVRCPAHAQVVRWASIRPRASIKCLNE